MVQAINCCCVVIGFMLSKYFRATRPIRLGGGRVEFYYMNSLLVTFSWIDTITVNWVKIRAESSGIDSYDNEISIKICNQALVNVRYMFYIQASQLGVVSEDSRW